MRPLRQTNPIYAAFDRYASALERHFNAGQYQHGVIAWCLAVLPIAIATALISYLLHAVSPLASWLWNIAVLYLTMGFRQFSHYFTEIMHALRDGNIATAREYVGRWRGNSAEEFTPSEIARVSIELGLAGSHRHVFGPIAWFVVLGPAGAVLYRTSTILAEKWAARRDAEVGAFGEFAQRFFHGLDWVPARLTAASFAIVGNFEDAIYCWRTQAATWAARAEGNAAAAPALILASGGGALGVRLGNALREPGSVEFRPELGLGEEADVDYMQSAVGLIWRALVLWMFLVLVVTVAHSLG